LSVVEQSGNGRAVEILRGSGGSYNDILMKIRNSNGAGSFEGYLLDDELEAKQIVTELLNFNRTDANASERCEVFERLSKLISSGKVWWNGRKPQLPPDYIDRRVFNQTKETKTETTLLDLVLPCNNGDPDWNKWDDQVLVLIVDSPGMGKSCSLTRLEQELRKKLDKSPRVIVRINLNSVGKVTAGESAVENGVKEVIKELFQPLKDCSTGERASPVYILLDGLDEVLAQNQESVLSVLRFLLSDKSITKEWVVEKVVLTTRPHLKHFIESEFNVPAHYLVLLTKEEQIKFIQERTGRTDSRRLLVLSFMKELMTNPLMLSMYCSIILIPSKKSESTFDQYEIYARFMVKKHELYVSEKIGRPYVPNRVVKQLLTSNVPFYNCVAKREILGENMLSIVIDLAEKAGRPELIQDASSPGQQSELISFGVVVKVGEELKFVHRSFGEFFFARLMTDVDKTPSDVRNALFAWGYPMDNNVAKFVLCGVGKDKETVQFVSKGWTKFVPEGENLERYVGIYKSRYDAFWFSAVEYEGKTLLLDHIMSSTIEYEGNCPGKNELIVRDVYTDGVVFLWLKEKTNETCVRNFLLHENNTRILAAFVLSVDFKYRDKDWKNVFVPRELYQDALLERMTSVPLKERVTLAQDILRDICHNYENLHPLIYTFLASAFSKEKVHHLIVNEESI